MAKKPNQKSSYVVLDDARAYYDRNNDSVHLTIKDTEIPEGIHLSLNSTREDEKRLRRVLDAHGLLNKSDLMIEYDLLKKVAREFNGGAAHMPHDAKNRIPFGFSAKSPMSWNLEKDSHLLMIGSPGSGKSVVLKNIAEYVVEFGEYEDMELLYAKNSFDSAYSFKDTVRNIKKAKAIVEERYREIVESISNNEEYIPSSKVILIVDDLSYLAQHDIETAKTLLGIVRMGLSVGVHVVSSSFGPTSNFEESPAAAEVAGKLNRAFPATFNMRHYHPSDIFSTAEKALLKMLDNGCGMLINSSGKTLVQIVPYRNVMNAPGWFTTKKKSV